MNTRNESKIKEELKAKTDVREENTSDIFDLLF